MKKIIAVIMVSALCVFGLCGCNQNIGIGNLSFKHAHFSDGISGHCVTVTSWHDDDMGCEIHTPDGGIFLSEGTYQLFENATACPYCD
ncbi:MAG: hypothetical protein Q4E51_08650 [Lachnospiraceae bacterium]|nr:hypothetical protein [Lachnospiraceae bacterium]